MANTHSLLVGVQIHIPIMKMNMLVPREDGNMSTTRSNNSTTEYLSKELITLSKKQLEPCLFLLLPVITVL